MTPTIKDAETAESLANAICGCATREQRKNDTHALLAYAEQAAAAERAKVLDWLARAEESFDGTAGDGIGYARRMIEALAHHEGEAATINAPEGEGA